MADNLKALNAIPVFGFEWRNCYCDTDKKNFEYEERNIGRFAAAIPFMNFYCGYQFIRVGVEFLSFSGEKTEASEGENDNGFAPGGVNYPKMKGMAFIVRGIATFFFAGALFILVDAATSLGRAAHRKEKAQEKDGNPSV